MRGSKGTASLDIIVATSIVALLAIAVFTCFKVGISINEQNNIVNSYKAHVITKLTELEGLDPLSLYLLNSTEEVDEGITYSYTCSKSSYNTIHTEVRAKYRALDYEFILEKVDKDSLVNP